MIILFLEITIFAIFTIIMFLMIMKIRNYNKHLIEDLEKMNMINKSLSKKRKTKDNALDISNSITETNSTELQDTANKYFNEHLSEIDDLIHNFHKKGFSENDIVTMVTNTLMNTRDIDGVERDSYFSLLIKNRIKKLSGTYKKTKKDVKKDSMSSSLNIDLDQNIVTSNNKDETHMVNLFDQDLSNFDNIQYDKD